MAISEEQVMKILTEIVVKAEEKELSKKILAVVYREDYQDYVVVLGDFCYVELREKLLSDYVEFGHGDVKREIVYKLVHSVKLEDWQIEDLGLGDQFSEDDIAKAMGNGGSGGGNDDSKSKIAVDDDEKYDWL